MTRDHHHRKRAVCLLHSCVLLSPMSCRSFGPMGRLLFVLANGFPFYDLPRLLFSPVPPITFCYSVTLSATQRLLLCLSLLLDPLRPAVGR